MQCIVLSGLLVFTAGALNANMDGLAHYKDRIIWQQWENDLSRWMLRGSNYRHIGNDPDNPLKPRFRTPLRPLFEIINDGWHGSKALMLFILLVPVPLLTVTWWQVILYVPLFQVSFHVFYHWVLPV